MKTSLAVLAVGLLGVLIGSLAAQQPVGNRQMDDRGILFFGDAEVLMDSEDPAQRSSSGHVRVYERWVIIEGKQIVPSDRVRKILLNSDREQNGFGDQPDADPNAVPDPNPNTSPKRRPFRED